MKLVMSDIVSINGALESIIKKSQTEAVPGFIAIKFARLAKDVTPLFTDFNEERQKLIQRMGETSSDQPDTVIVKPENVPAFNEEYSKLLAVEVELMPSVSFKESDFEALKMDVIEAYALLPFIKEENGSKNEAGV